MEGLASSNTALSLEYTANSVVNSQAEGAIAPLPEQPPSSFSVDSRSSEETISLLPTSESSTIDQIVLPQTTSDFIVTSSNATDTPQSESDEDPLTGTAVGTALAGSDSTDNLTNNTASGVTEPSPEDLSAIETRENGDRSLETTSNATNADPYADNVFSDLSSNAQSASTEISATQIEQTSTPETGDPVTDDTSVERSVETKTSTIEIETTSSSATVDSSPFTFNSGVFTVGETGEVGIDFLFDGGGYEGELAIFSLEGMTEFEPGSAFIQEAARRALSRSELGHIVISDRSEAARFSAPLPHEGDFNFGDYQGVKTFAMRVGDTFALMLVPDGTVQQVFDRPEIGGATRPLFSLATANPVEGFHFGQVADVTGEGNTFVMEDLRIDANSDRDYNDLTFQLLGATGQAPLLNDVINSTKDWRTSEIGQELINYAQSATSANSIEVQPESEVAPVTQPTSESEDSTTDAIAPEIEPSETPISRSPEEETHQDQTAETDPIPVDESPTETNPPVTDSSESPVTDSSEPPVAESLESPVSDSSEPPVSDSSEPPVAETALPTSDLENIETTDDSDLSNEGLNPSASPYPATPEKQPEATQPPSSNHPQGSAAGDPLNDESNLLDPNTEPPTLQWGTFVVGDTGKVGVDFLFDGGAYRGELAIFSLEGMENLQPGSPEFIREAAARSLSKSTLGHVVISDSTDAARFQGELGEPSRNDGKYQGIESVTMNPGDRFGMMLVPRGTVQQVHQNPTIGGTTRPLFSLTSDPNRSQIADLTGKGNTFAFEDLSVHGNSDRDYNDIIFQVSGATGKAPVISEVIDPNKDWTDTPLGESIINYGNIEESEDTILDSLSDVVRYAVEAASDLDSYEPESLTSVTQWVIGVSPDQSSQKLATLLGVKDLGATNFIPHTYVWEFPNTISAEEVGKRLTEFAGVEFVYPLVPIQPVLLSEPQNEPLVANGQQWHLQSNVNPNADANITGAWEVTLNNSSQQVRGRGVVIGIVDDGLDINHPEFKDRYQSNLDWDFNQERDFIDDGNDRITYQKVFDGESQLIQDRTNKNWLPINVGLTGNVADVNVGLHISHPNTRDLEIFLANQPLYDPLTGLGSRYNRGGPIDPPGDYLEPVLLVDNRGGVGQIQLDDSAEKTIQQAIAPLAGTYKPENDLSELNGQSSRSSWWLNINDGDQKNLSEPEAKVEDWSLELTTYNSHGTAVAGIAAASGNNNLGGSGVAPEASTTLLRLVADRFLETRAAEALSNNEQYNIDIYNNSWKPDKNWLPMPDTRMPSVIQAMESGVQQGRDQRGSIYVFAAGNDAEEGGNVNFNPLASSRYAIAVGAIDSEGKKAKYSEPGAPLLVSAYSGSRNQKITTTDLAGALGNNSTDYRTNFSGTSAAAPLVSGAIALMLEVNPSLTWRDVQHILVRTAKQNDPEDSNWFKNGAGYHINSNYGFGAIDVEAAVKLAKVWQNVAPETSVQPDKIVINQSTPIDGTPLTSKITVKEDITLEKVEVVFDADHPYRGDLEVVLVHTYTGADGKLSTTESILAPFRNDSDDNYDTWTFTSARHWGESSLGEWTLEVRDRKNHGVILEDKGTLNFWELNLFGTASAAPRLTAIAPLSGAVVNQQFTITYEDLLKASDASDANGDVISFLVDVISSGTLTKNGVPVIPGETTLSPQESLVWTPNRPGDEVPAFTIQAQDSRLVSATPVQVSARVETLAIPLDNWNTRLINRTYVDYGDRNSYNFSNPDAVLNLGPQGGVWSDGRLHLLRDWGVNPASGIQLDHFAMESRTRTRFEAGKQYKITSKSDDGVWVGLKDPNNDQLVSLRDASQDRTVNDGFWDAWGDRSVFDPPIEMFFEVPQAGDYDVVVDYYERTSGSKVDVMIEPVVFTGQVISTVDALVRLDPNRSRPPVGSFPPKATVTFDKVVKGELIDYRDELGSQRISDRWYRIAGSQPEQWISAAILEGKP